MKKFFVFVLALTIFLPTCALAPSGVNAQEGDSCLDAVVNYLTFEDEVNPTYIPAVNGRAHQMVGIAQDLEILENGQLKVLYDGMGFYFGDPKIFVPEEGGLKVFEVVIDHDGNVVDYLYTTDAEPGKLFVASNGQALITLLYSDVVDVDLTPTGDNQWWLGVLDNRGMLLTAVVVGRINVNTEELVGFKIDSWGKIYPNVSQMALSTNWQWINQDGGEPTAQATIYKPFKAMYLTFRLGYDSPTEGQGSDMGMAMISYPILQLYVDGDVINIAHRLIEQMIVNDLWMLGCEPAQ